MRSLRSPNHTLLIWILWTLVSVLAMALAWAWWPRSPRVMLAVGPPLPPLVQYRGSIAQHTLEAKLSIIDSQLQEVETYLEAHPSAPPSP
jgi:hypothetical protein